MNLRPKPIYWLSRYLMILVMACIALSAPLYVPDDLNTDYRLSALLQTIGIIVCIVLAYTYIDMLFFTTWRITDERIETERGVFVRKRGYIELYRVVDYEESQSFVQLLFRNKNVKIFSGDRTNPALEIYGIDNSANVIDYIRPRVETQKKRHGVYEVTNR